MKILVKNKKYDIDIKEGALVQGYYTHDVTIIDEEEVFRYVKVECTDVDWAFIYKDKPNKLDLYINLVIKKIEDLINDDDGQDKILITRFDTQLAN